MNDLQLSCPDLPETSVFNLPAFPNKTNKITFSPFQVKKALDDFSVMSGTFESHCKRNHIRFKTIMLLMNVYDEIRLYYWRAQERHTEIWAQELEEIADDESRDTTKVIKTNTKTGEVTEYEQGNMVATRRDDIRTKIRLALMERLNPRYRPKSETTTRNLNANINLTVPVSKLGEQPLDQLLQGMD
jgi:hypothetical protein